MITLSASGGSVTFEFSGNSTYLNDGQITVPVNSLALIIDESDMATFRKAASNDIFVSANIAEFGMTKAELESWYKANMVSSSGGGGGVTPEEAEEMINEAVSGKADTSSLATVATSGSYDDLLNKPTIPSLDGYATEQWVSGFTYDKNTIDEKVAGGGSFDPTQYYNKTTTDELLAEKLDTSAYTPVDLSEYWTSAQTESAIETSVSGKVDTDTYTAYTAATDTVLDGKADISDIPSVSGYADSVKYNSTSKYVEFYHGGTGGTKVFEYDASPFLIDGMVQNVEIKDVTISGESVTCLVISFNTDAGKQDINIPISEIFNANNYYTKTETDNAITAATNGLAVATAVTQEISEAVSGKQDTFANEDVLSGITSTDITNWNSKSDFSGSYNDLTDKPTIPTVPTSNTAFTNDAGYITSGEAQSQIDNSISGKVDASTYTAYTAATDAVLASKADTATTYTKTEVDNAITAATATKQDTLVSSVNIKTINNESLLGSGNIDIQGGGGKAVTGGTNISVTTGETADTINCTLNAKNGTGGYSFIANGIIGGSMNSATGQSATAFGISNNANGRVSFAIGGSNYSDGEYSFAGGTSSVAKGDTSFAFGYMAQAKGAYSIAIGSYFTLAENDTEVALGKANVSHTGSTDADKTLFSVGNGTNTSNRHNAFEIRKNGDIYCSDGTNDVKLQDTITATATNTTALGGLKLVKLSQSEYDNLATKDNSTLYVIVN